MWIFKNKEEELKKKLIKSSEVSILQSTFFLYIN